MPLQGDHTGRLLKYDPTSRKTSFVAGDLFYANGVAIAKDESFVLVAETSRVTIHRIWLKGKKARPHYPFKSEKAQ